MASVDFVNITKVYPGAQAPAVDDLNLQVADGEFLVLVGPSGCGKSTSLRMLAGLEDVTGGQIFLGGKDITHTSPKQRDIAMVFQNYALYPNMTVRQIMGFALKMSKVPKPEIDRRVDAASEILDLGPYLERKPKALSGGQRQRVAMGRAIVREPQAFLMDEPLSNLDAKLRVQTRAELASLQRRLQTTTVYVTHDQVEAMTMGDRIALMKDGLLQQVGTPRELFDTPDNAFVASFIGSPSMNMVSAHVTSDGEARMGDRPIPVPRQVLAQAKQSDVTIGFRPEDATITSDGWPLKVLTVEELGADAYVYGSSPMAGADQMLVVRTEGRITPRLGETVHFEVDPEHVHVFDASTGKRLAA